MKRVSGIVVEGNKKGRKLDFPTANIVLSEALASGIYLGKVNVSGKEFVGAIFISPDGKLLEVHILDFGGDLYGQVIEVKIGKKIRAVKKFKSEADLKKQIAADIAHIRGLNSRP